MFQTAGQTFAYSWNKGHLLLFLNTAGKLKPPLRCWVLRLRSDMRHLKLKAGMLAVDHAAWLYTVHSHFHTLGGTLCLWIRNTPVKRPSSD